MRILFLLVVAVVAATVTAAPVPKDFGQTFAARYGVAHPIDADCVVAMKQGKLRIAVEGGKHSGFDGDGNFRMPHVAKHLTGDFTAVVTVESGDVPRHAPNTFEVYEAGLFVRSDGKVAGLFAVQHLRSNIQPQTAGVCHLRKPGWAMSCGEAGGFGRPRVRLKLERAGELLTASVEVEPNRWAEVSAQKLPFKKSVQVGLYVSSTGKPFEATFVDYDATAK